MKPKFFELAKKLSKKSDYSQYHLGACVVKKNRVLGIGFNRNRTHPKANSLYHYLHAEIDSLLGLNFTQLKNATMYIYRETKLGAPALAKPCPSCRIAIENSGIKRIIYTTHLGYTEEVIL
jgi:deoxycytidylate deaminase